MCAALNLCGWAHACHTLDVDVLLFGALTVYRQMHLQVRAARLRLCSVGHASVEIVVQQEGKLVGGHCTAMQCKCSRDLVCSSTLRQQGSCHVEFAGTAQPRTTKQAAAASMCRRTTRASRAWCAAAAMTCSGCWASRGAARLRCSASRSWQAATTTPRARSRCGHQGCMRTFGLQGCECL